MKLNKEELQTLDNAITVLNSICNNRDILNEKNIAEKCEHCPLDRGGYHCLAVDMILFTNDRKHD